VIVKQNKLLAKFLDWTYVPWNDRDKYDFNFPYPFDKKDIKIERIERVEGTTHVINTKVTHIPTGTSIVPPMLFKMACKDTFVPGWYATSFPFPFAKRKGWTPFHYKGRNNLALNFDTSLDALVPVVNKLAENGFNIRIAVYSPDNIPYKYSVTFDGVNYTIDGNMVKAIYGACVAAVKKFNLNNLKNERD